MTGGIGSTGQRSVPYATALAFPAPLQRPTPVVVTQLQTDVQGVLARSTAFTARENLKVATEGTVIVLQGSVANERESRLAEAMIRLTPGVREVRNELTIVETTPPPTPVP